ncbi:conserved membrane hypothetical protein [Nostocoides japonicum T1-X7]|uniref:Integral membrane protein n=1 Tax=Nostocoides japonicum T1-X7 TaxID=1194083 RepID=A0A077M0E2_9MICO|nr:hypothetical protein [Tetrasphaera japonica]CCH77680.1 conserved membrane hypothetical protein [Tetrasphaera japonica T1-X7]
MNVSTFYALFSTTCLALVGLWWGVVDRRRDLTADAPGRRLAGGVYLSFLLPGLMGLFAQVAPDRSVVWRTCFAVVSVVGCASTIALVRREAGSRPPGPLARNRWLVAVAYGLVAVVAVTPASVTAHTGLAPIQLAAIVLILLVLLGHGLAWELLLSRDDESS